jgi:hypothetical protein
MANVKVNWDDLSDDETSSTSTSSTSTSTSSSNIKNNVALEQKNVINNKNPLPPIPAKRQTVKKQVHVKHTIQSRLKSIKKKLEDGQNQEDSQDDDDNMYDYETERMDKKFGTHFTLK